jgi:GrpB-like predicted nucleotidyltransferase (UPF0157 family)
MPPPIPVVLAPYDPAWPEMAIRYGQRLQMLGHVLVKVHHIGSTSVPGMSAKPIIDLMPVVTDLTELDRRQSLVTAIGIEWHGELGITGRRYCTLSDEIGKRLAQLHFFQADSPEIVRHLAFRDYLRAHHDVARAYEKEKHRARGLYPSDSHAYTDAKDAWIRNIETSALDWFKRRTS